MILTILGADRLYVDGQMQEIKALEADFRFMEIQEA